MGYFDKDWIVDRFNKNVEFRVVHGAVAEIDVRNNKTNKHT